MKAEARFSTAYFAQHDIAAPNANAMQVQSTAHLELTPDVGIGQGELQQTRVQWPCVGYVFT